jgi:hypothetical protein
MSASFVSGGSGSSISGGASALGPGVGIATSILKVGLTELSEHTARVTGATNENEAADQIIPAYDADLKAIQTAWNLGQLSLAQAEQALAAVDANVYKYLRAQVGKPGTAWNVNAFGVCNKSCTVGCCLYNNDLHPGIYGAAAFWGGTVGIIPVLRGVVATGGATPRYAYIPEVYPPSDTSYGNYSRPAYWLYFNPNPPSGNSEQVSATVDGLLGQAPALTPSGAAPAAKGIVSVLTNNTLVTVVTLIGGILIIAAYLFGSNAVRVNK